MNGPAPHRDFRGERPIRCDQPSGNRFILHPLAEAAAPRYAGSMIAHTIQLALAPVFVLVAMGNILNLLSTRLGRIVDRARVLQKRHAETTGGEHDMVVSEMRTIDVRILLITRAIRNLVVAGLMIGMTVASLFVEEMASYPLETVAAVFFVSAIALLMWALVQFLRETRVAAESLRIPDQYLERHRGKL